MLPGYPGLPPPQQKESNCGKVLFMLLNVIFLISGLLALAVGLYLRIMKSGYPISLIPSLNFYLTTTILASPGVAILLVAILGFCGSTKYGRPYMIAFVVVLAFLVLVQGGAVVCVVLYKPLILAFVEDMIAAGIGETSRMKTWDDVQRSIKCCGVHNYTNWQGYLASPNPLAVPDSCCISHLYNYPGCGEAGGYRAYERGCVSMLITWIGNNLQIAGGGGIAFGAVQVLLLCLGMSLACCRKSPNKEFGQSQDPFGQNQGMPPGFLMPPGQFPGMYGQQQYPDMMQGMM